MYCNIVKITDINGKDRTDKDSLSRIGRIINMNDSKFQIGNRALLICHKPGIDKSILTSLVLDVIEADDGIILKTEHSYYYLIKESLGS